MSGSLTMEKHLELHHGAICDKGVKLPLTKAKYICCDDMRGVHIVSISVTLGMTLFVQCPLAINSLAWSL